MRRNFTLLLSVVMLFALASCGGKTDTPTDTKSGEHVHNWEDATCVTPRFCSGCGEIDGEPLGHDMLPATDDTPSTCSRCGYTTGGPIVFVSFSYEKGAFSARIENGVLIIDGEGPMEDGYNDYNGVPWYGYGLVIEDVIIGSGITTIGSNAFHRCVNVRSITIPDGVTTIGSNAFFECSRLTSITLPDSVTEIGAYAFQRCTSLTDIMISDSVTEIGSGAFAECASLTEITIPSGVEKLGVGVFDSCTSLEDIVVASGNPYYTTIDGVLFDGSMTSLYAYPAGKTADEYVIPDGVTAIWDSAFAGCAGLTSITIPDSVTAIGNYAFSGCTALTSLAIPSGVTSISSSTFQDCVSLTSITIPSSVETLYKYIFSDCKKLTDIYYEGTAEEWAEHFSNVNISGRVTVHYGYTA